MDNEEILKETLERFNEIKMDMFFIQKVHENYNSYHNKNYYNDRKEVEELIKSTIDLIIKNKDINLIIPINFNVVNDINDNINRIIYWCFHTYYYPHRYINFYNEKIEYLGNQITKLKNKNLKLHNSIIEQQEHFYNEDIKINKILLKIKKEYKFNMIIIMNLQIFILVVSIFSYFI